MISPHPAYDDLLLFAISWVKEYVGGDGEELAERVAIALAMLERELPAIARLMECHEELPFIGPARGDRPGTPRACSRPLAVCLR